ncbi:MAG: head-tail adaptor protein [Actinomycetes bacterium]
MLNSPADIVSMQATLLESYGHQLVIERATDGALDAYGQPARTYATLATVRGLVQPKTAQEVALTNQAGAVISTHTIYLLPTDVTAADRIRFEPDDGRLFQLDGVRDVAGLGIHLELDARLVGAV